MNQDTPPPNPQEYPGERIVAPQEIVSTMFLSLEMGPAYELDTSALYEIATLVDQADINFFPLKYSRHYSGKFFDNPFHVFFRTRHLGVISIAFSAWTLDLVHENSFRAWMEQIVQYITEKQQEAGATTSVMTSLVPEYARFRLAIPDLYKIVKLDIARVPGQPGEFTCRLSAESMALLEES